MRIFTQPTSLRTVVNNSNILNLITSAGTILIIFVLFLLILNFYKNPNENRSTRVRYGTTESNHFPSVPPIQRIFGCSSGESCQRYPFIYRIIFHFWLRWLGSSESEILKRDTVIKDFQPRKTFKTIVKLFLIIYSTAVQCCVIL